MPTTTTKKFIFVAALLAAGAVLAATATHFANGIIVTGAAGSAGVDARAVNGPALSGAASGTGAGVYAASLSGPALHMAPRAGAPTSTTEGDVWLDGTAHTLRANINNVNQFVAAAPTAGTSGQVLTATSPGAAWQNAGQIDYATGRRWGSVYMVNPAASGGSGAAAFSQWGMQAPAVALPNGGSNTAGKYRNWTYIATAATNGSVAGINGPYTETQTFFQPVITFSAGSFSVSAMTAQRLVFALASGDPSGLTAAAGPTASGLSFIGIWADSAVSANWKVCSGDGTNYSCTDTGVAYANDVTIRVKLDWTAITSFTATLWTTTPYTSIDNFVQQFSTTKSSNVSSTTATTYGPAHLVKALENVQHSVWVNGYHLQQNF